MPSSATASAARCCAPLLLARLAGETDLARIIAKVAEARLAVVSLPLCNLYLQDRRPGRTPRWRVAPCTSSAPRACR